MKTSEEFIVDVKTKAGDQRTRDGQLIRDMDDKELMKRMLERYPGERENIVDIDEYLGEEVKDLSEGPAKSDVQQRLDEVTKSPSFLERIKNRAVDTFQNVKSEIQGTGENEGESALRRGFDAVADTVTSVPGFAKDALPEPIRNTIDYVGEKGGELYNKAVIEPLANTELIKGAAGHTVTNADGTTTYVPNDLGVLEDALGIAQSGGEIASSILGAKGVLEAWKMGVDVAKNAPAKIDAALEPRRQAKIEQRKAEADDAVKRIIQPTGKTTAERASQLEASKRVLSEVDANDIPDYQSGKEVFDERIKTIAENQDAHMAQFTEKYKPDQLGTYTKVGDETVATNPVQDALDGLENAYTLSGDAVEATKIKQLRAKMESEGLTVSEINKIARDYNIEFKNKAFDKMGNPKAGFNAENYESVRKGVKQVARDRMPDDISKELDAKLSDTYEVRSLFDRLAVEVDKLGAKANEPGMLARVAGGAVELTDILSGRLLGGVLRTLASKSGILQKGRVSFADLEKELQSNIKKFQKANSTNDPQKFSEYLNEIKPGLSTNNEINPE